MLKINEVDGKLSVKGIGLSMKINTNFNINRFTFNKKNNKKISFKKQFKESEEESKEESSEENL